MRIDAIQRYWDGITPEDRLLTREQAAYIAAVMDQVGCGPESPKVLWLALHSVPVDAPVVWQVPSLTREGHYHRVDVVAETCDCEYYQYRRECKSHLPAARFAAALALRLSRPMRQASAGERRAVLAGRR
jgi:hypothetical protein